MAKGWKIVTVLPNPGGAAPLQEWSLVAIADKSQAIRAIKARHPHAAIRVDSEADAELLAKYGVLDGKIFVLVGRHMMPLTNAVLAYVRRIADHV